MLASLAREEIKKIAANVLLCQRDIWRMAKEYSDAARVNSEAKKKDLLIFKK